MKLSWPNLIVTMKLRSTVIKKKSVVLVVLGLVIVISCFYRFNNNIGNVKIYFSKIQSNLVVQNISKVSKTNRYVVSPNSSIYCYSAEENSLIDISNADIRKDKNIFFHETSCRYHKTGRISLTSRQACAVESAAKMHPKLDVYLIFVSPGVIGVEKTESNNILNAVLSYKNVKFIHIDFEKYTRNTTVQDVYRSGKLERSKWPESHTSDVLRYLTLSKYGGIYLDLDVVVIKPLDKLAPNFAGIQSDEIINSGVLRFRYADKFAKMCLEDLKINFNGFIWGQNEPGVITRLSTKLCNVHRFNTTKLYNCQGFTVYPSKKFYPIPYQNWEMYFHKKYNNQVKDLTKDTYAIHLWNKMSGHKNIVVGSDIPYAKYAEKFCPKVYKECGKRF